MTRFQSLLRSSLLALLVGACFVAGAVESEGEPGADHGADMGSVVQQAQELIDAQQPDAALAVLEPVLQNFAGSPRFDYVLALALMDSGDNATAELVFQRLLTQSPRFHGARLDYARVLVARQKYAIAMTQLDTLSDTKPPQKAQAEIVQLRSVIEQRSRSTRWSRYLSVSTAAGYDSNVNSATVVDEFLGFTLDGTSQEQDSEFFEFGAVVGAGYQLSRGMRLSGSIEYRKRENPQASFVDSDALTLDTMLVRVTDTDYQQLKLVGYQFDIDGARNSEGVSLRGSWLRKITPLWRIGIQGEASRIQFGESLEVKDVDRFKVGLIGAYSIGQNAQGQLLLRAGAGTDEPRLSGSRYARDFVYAGSSLSWWFTDTVRAGVYLDYQNSQFDDVFFEELYVAAREDDFYRLAASVNWNFRPAWALSHSLTYFRNDTFVDIFEYERFEASLRIRYKFQ